VNVHGNPAGRVRASVEARPVLLVATAPAGEDGHVDVSRADPR
jgi:hypothetical protein